MHIWSLTDYEKVFYIDADCLIKASPEDVFEREVDFAAAPDVFPPDRFNAGVMLIVMLFVLSSFRSHHLMCWLT